MLLIKSAFFINKKGKNSINEDSIISIPGKLYLVCDGVGGNGNGLLASHLLCNSISSSIQNESMFNLSNILQKAEKELSNYKKKNPATKSMASTIAFTKIHESFITIAWIGDSSVYHIRNGKIIYKTINHSWVAEAIVRGELTELESYFHPNRNQLTRSVKGVEEPSEFDSLVCDAVQEDDIFLLCTDGIQESWIDADFEALFSTQNTTEEIINQIDKQCEKFSDDNYSAILFQIGAVNTVNDEN
jgi:serine/threonine protein phosphatase PrpC